MSEKLSVNHLLGIKYLIPEDLKLIFKTTNHFKEVINRSIKKVPTLRHITIANLFFENSTRTKISFEIAEKRLSADVVNFSAGYSSLKKGESLIDTVNNILAMKVDIVIIRHPACGTPFFLSKNTNSCIINAGDGTHEHPTQALIDAFSIKEKLGTIKGKKVVIVGDVLHSRVALSNIFLLKMLGAQVKICAPKNLTPKYINKLGVELETDLFKALQWCDACNMLRMQNERIKENLFPSIREYTKLYGLNLPLLNRLEKEILILHPGPINRGVEITSDIADSHHSIILDQVENGVAIRMGIIYLLASKLNTSKYEKRNQR